MKRILDCLIAALLWPFYLSLLPLLAILTCADEKGCPPWVLFLVVVFYCYGLAALTGAALVWLVGMVF